MNHTLGKIVALAIGVLAFGFIRVFMYIILKDNVLRAIDIIQSRILGGSLSDNPLPRNKDPIDQSLQEKLKGANFVRSYDARKNDTNKNKFAELKSVLQLFKVSSDEE